jgi:hypothetical protein
MVRKRSRASVVVSSDEADDFELIRGIGPVFARQLQAAGIRTYTQLASLSPAKVASVVAGPLAEQIAKQDWIGQARNLALKQKPPKRRTKEPVPPGDLPLHRVNFRVELVLGEGNEVHHTNVVHIQRGGKDTWAGWQASRLIDYIVQHSGLRLPPPEPAPPFAKTPEPAASNAVTNLTGTVRLRNAEIVPIDAGSPTGAITVGRPFNVLVTLDLSDVIAPSAAPLAYTAFLHAKTLGGGTRQIIGEARGTLMNSNTIMARVEGAVLSLGLYQLKAVVTLVLEPMKMSAHSSLTAIKEIGLLQIY